MMRRLARLGSGVGLVVACSAWLQAAAAAPVAEAVMQGDVTALRRQLAAGADVNAAQGDGMTALHWAATKGRADLATMLLAAGARPAATTRLGGFTPLHLAARAGSAAIVDALVTAGADVTATTSTGTTALMLAAESGVVTAVERLVRAGAAVNAVESAKGQSALMFAAAYDRADVVAFLLANGADPTLSTTVHDLAKLTDPGQDRAPGGRAAPRQVQVPGLSRQFRYNELIGTQGGLTALLFATREGYTGSALALLAGGADVNQVNPGDRTSPLLMAVVNGHFDLAMRYLDEGADVSLAAANGVAPLYATLNNRWAPKSLYPNPKAYQQQQTTYLALMRALLDRGADPNARVQRKVWYQAFNSDFAGVDEIGATPFWRAAYASDVEAMRLLVRYGADPHIPTTKPAGRPFTGDGIRQTQDVSGLPPVPVGGPAVPPLLAAAGVGYGEGFAANAHRYAETGFLPAIKYLVEEVGADVNAVDHEGNTAVHHAAARGDNASIEYLVSRGALVTTLNREGQTTADMANGPVQRTQPYPDTVALLERLGATNHHLCVSC
jgi:ankyrin repeat protein